MKTEKKLLAKDVFTQSFFKSVADLNLMQITRFFDVIGSVYIIRGCYITKGLVKSLNKICGKKLTWFHHSNGDLAFYLYF